jgi:hypothetical protein
VVAINLFSPIDENPGLPDKTREERIGASPARTPPRATERRARTTRTAPRRARIVVEPRIAPASSSAHRASEDRARVRYPARRDAIARRRHVDALALSGKKKSPAPTRTSSSHHPAAA